MKRFLIVFSLLIFAMTAEASDRATSKNLSDVKKSMIRLSIETYLKNEGSCPCPYSVTKDGRRCGEMSAYERPGGLKPLCSPKDISNEQAKAFRAKAKQKEAAILDSIAEYDGSCPCPYSVMKNGRRCGKTSAYLKPGGEKPKCYIQDFASEMLEVVK